MFCPTRSVALPIALEVFWGFRDYFTASITVTLNRNSETKKLLNWDFLSLLFVFQIPSTYMCMTEKCTLRAALSEINCAFHILVRVGN